MSIPTARELCDATGISPSYAHMILSGDRKPARPLAIEIFRKLDWRHAVIADLTPEEIDTLERIEARAA
jgi:hypothetical protein